MKLKDEIFNEMADKVCAEQEAYMNFAATNVGNHEAIHNEWEQMRVRVLNTFDLYGTTEDEYVTELERRIAANGGFGGREKGNGVD